MPRRRNPNPLTLLLLATLLAGCGGRTSSPLYSTVPVLEELPRFAPLAQREVPSSTREVIQIRLDPGSTAPSPDDVVNSPGVRRRTPDVRPSVIISVPAEATIAAREAAELRSLGRVPTANADAPDPRNRERELESFRTDGYYNQAEQQVETALLRQGFDVLDRAKFEAKLRDLRDRQAETLSPFVRRYAEVAQAAGTDVALARLRRELEANEITLEEFREASREIERAGQLSLPGQRRLEDEMVDIAEVIRAAQTGEDRADFLLQISGVRVESSANRQFNIANFPETRAFLEQNPGLRLGDGAGMLPAAVPARWFRAEFNAKLIEVQTGSIVWLGNHVLESRHAEPITLRIDVERRVSNGEEVSRTIRSYNEEGTRLARAAAQSQAALDQLYLEAQTPQSFPDRDALEEWEARTRTAIAEEERRYRDLREGLATHQSRRPSAFDAPWEYEYLVSSPVVEPDLANLAEGGVAAQERLEQHRANLIRELTRALIGTIRVF